MKTIKLNWKEYVKYSYLVKNRWECLDYIGQNKWKTKYQILYWIDYTFKNEYIIIPKWYKFDFNSVPCFWMCIVWKDEFMIALIHDRLYWLNWKINIIDKQSLSPIFNWLKSWYWYENEEVWNINTMTFLYDRKMADKIWLFWAINEKMNMERIDVSKRASLWYLAIRLWWRRRFRKNK
jgi:hypothetical protein